MPFRAVVQPKQWNLHRGLTDTEWDWWWRYDHRFAFCGWPGGGTSVRNLVGGQENLTFVSGDNGLPTWIRTPYGWAIDFKKAQDRVEVADNASLSITGALTLAAFFRVDSENVGNAGIIAKYIGVPTADRAYEIYVATQSAAMAVGFAISDDGTFKAAGSLNSGTNALVLEQFHFVVARFIPLVSQDIFVDGVNVASDTTSILASIDDSDAPFQLGHQFEDAEANGGLDGPIILGSAIAGALTDKEIFRWSENPLGPFLMAPRRNVKAAAAAAEEFLSRSYPQGVGRGVMRGAA